MISIFIQLIQHEQYYLIILIIDLKAETLLKGRPWHLRFPMNFVKFLETPFFIGHIRVTAFGLSFANP